MRRLTISSLALSMMLWLGGCDRGQSPPAGSTQPAGGSTSAGAATSAGELSLPDVDVSGLPFGVQTKIGSARTVARRSPDDAQKVFDLAALYYAHNLAPAAIACLQQCAKAKPEDFGVHYALGLAYEAAKDEAKAQAAYERAVSLESGYLKEHPDEGLKSYVPLYIRLAALLLDKDPARAKELLRTVVEGHDDANRACGYVGLALCALGAGQLAEAEKLARQALGLAPEFGPAHRAMAEILKAGGREADAARHERLGKGSPRLAPLVDLFQAGLLRTGGDVNTLLAEGRALAERGDYAKAEAAIRLAADVDDTGYLARCAIAWVRIAQGKFEDAAGELKSVLESHPDCLVAKSNLALAYTGLGKTKEAEGLLREVLEKQPRSTETLERFCRLMQREGRPDEAVAALQRALADAPDGIIIHYRVADMLADLGQADEGLKVVRKAVEMQPEYPPARSLLGTLLYRRGDKAAAKQEWAEALRLDPGQLAARGALAEALFAEKDYESAEKLLREGLDRYPNNPPLANTLAWLLATSPIEKQRNGAEAVKWAEKACEQVRYRQPGFLDTLAAAYAEAGKFEQARRAIAAAMQLAQAEKREDLVAEFRERAALYEKEQAYHLPG